jgi:hypothetical protein
MKTTSTRQNELGRTPTDGCMDAVQRNKIKLQRLAEITQRDPGELRENILGDVLNQIFEDGCHDLIECFVSPSYKKEEAETVVQRYNSFAVNRSGYIPASVVNAGKQFAVDFGR